MLVSMRPIVITVLLGVASATSGCATTGARSAAVAEAAEGFQAALRSQDSGRVCAALAPATREELDATAPALRPWRRCA